MAIKVTGVTVIDDNFNADVENLTAASVQLTGGTGTQGTLTWNADEETLDLVQDGTTLQLGHELEVHCRNNSGSTIPAGTVVKATGTVGGSGRITIAPFVADGNTNVKYMLGVTSEAIANDADGKVNSFGKIKGLDTSAYTEGTVLYVSTTTPGAFTATEPTSPAMSVPVAFVISSANNGTIFVRVHPEDENEVITAVNSSAATKVDKINITGGSVGSASEVPIITYNSQGQITSASTTTVAGVSSFTYDSPTEVLTINTADGGSFTADVSALWTQDNTKITNWDTAYGWGDHGAAGYEVSANLGTAAYTASTDYATAAQGTLADSALQASDLIGIATENYVDTAVSNLVDTAPATLDTLNELAAALGDDPNFATTVSTNIGSRVAKSGDTMTGNLAFGDNDKAIFGAGSDLQIYHDGNNSYVGEFGTGDLVLQSNGNKIGLANSSPFEWMVEANTNGAVNLYHNGSPKLSTTSTGVDVTGTVTADGLTVDGTALVENGNKVRVERPDGLTYSEFYMDIGANGGTQIYNHNNDGFKFHQGNGQTKLQIYGNGDISFYEDTGSSPKFFWDASAESLGIGQGVFSGTQALNIKGEGLAIKNDRNGSSNNWSIIRNTAIGSESNLSFVSGQGEAMVIDHFRNVGIGTAAPNSNLHIKSSSDVKLTLETDEDSDCWINLSGATSEASIGYEPATNSLRFANAADGVTSNIRMTIDADGNVGIGTTSPSNKLHVTGSIIAGTSATSGSVAMYNEYNSGSNDFIALWGSEYSSGGAIMGYGVRSTSTGWLSTYDNFNGNHGVLVVDGADLKFHADLSNSQTPVGQAVTLNEFFSVGRAGTVFNEDGNDIDFRVESDTNTHAIFLDGGQNNLIFGRSTTSGFYNGTGPTGMAMEQIGSGNETIMCNNSGNSNMYLSKVSGFTNSNYIVFSIGGTGTVGSIQGSTSGTTYNTTSDRRLKDNITTITDGKEKLLAMNPVTHTWKADPDAPAVHGFIAQEMQEVVPEAVTGEPDGDTMMSMDYGRITPVIVAALQDALKEIEELKTRINELEAK